jgi:hypothetical protein
MTSNSSDDDKPILNLRPPVDLTKFQDMLKSLDNVDDRRKILWMEIYTNAVHTNEMAADLYDDLQAKILEEPIHHATYGAQATKYLERMQKANDQLLKLSELIDAATTDEGSVDPNTILDMIEENG